MSCQPVSIKIPGKENEMGGLFCTTTNTMLPVTFDDFDAAREFDAWFSRVFKRDPRGASTPELMDTASIWRAMKRKVKGQ